MKLLAVDTALDALAVALLRRDGDRVEVLWTRDDELVTEGRT